MTNGQALKGYVSKFLWFLPSYNPLHRQINLLLKNNPKTGLSPIHTDTVLNFMNVGRDYLDFTFHGHPKFDLI